MQIWKLLFFLLLPCLVLTGCGTGSQENTKSMMRQEVATAVPEQGIPVLMYHMIGDAEDNDAVSNSFASIISSIKKYSASSRACAIAR